MTASPDRLLEIVRDAGSGAGRALPADLLKLSGMDRDSIVRGIEDLARRGLVTIDGPSGAVTLTGSGRAALNDAADAAEVTALTPGSGSAPQPQPEGGVPRAVPGANVEPASSVPHPMPGTEPVMGTPAGDSVDTRRDPEAADPPRTRRRSSGQATGGKSTKGSGRKRQGGSGRTR